MGDLIDGKNILLSHIVSRAGKSELKYIENGKNYAKNHLVDYSTPPNFTELFKVGDHTKEVVLWSYREVLENVEKILDNNVFKGEKHAKKMIKLIGNLINGKGPMNVKHLNKIIAKPNSPEPSAQSLTDLVNDVNGMNGKPKAKKNSGLDLDYKIIIWGLFADLGNLMKELKTAAKSFEANTTDPES